MATTEAKAASIGGVGDREITVPQFPASMDEFVALRNKIANTPDGGAAVYLVALLMYAKDIDLGLQAITVATDMKWIQQAAAGKGYKGFEPGKADQQRFKERLSGAKSYVARSYVQGTSPNSEYNIPAGPLTFKLKQQANSVMDESTVKLFVYCTGADSPRPITLKKNDKGLWKAYEWSSLTLGPRPPVKAVSDDL